MGPWRWGLPSGVALLCVSAVWAGDLDPPGAPRSTLGPEPRTAINQDNTPGDDEAHFLIAAPGSYYLPENFTASQVSTRNGIVIGVSDVTIDLNGFTLDGFNSPPIGPLGFFSNDTLTGILASGELENITVRNGTVRDWGEDGLGLLTADRCRVENVGVFACGGVGIHVRSDSVISGCQVINNGSTGIVNEFSGIIERCLVTDNDGFGILARGDTTVRGCVCDNNGQAGIFRTGGGAALIEGNVCSDNDLNGIEIFGPTLVVGNICHRNGLGSVRDGAGIRVFSGGSTIDQNTVMDNEIGISTEGSSGHVVTRNRAATNSMGNYVGMAGDDYGPIGSAATATSPWANISD